MFSTEQLGCPLGRLSPFDFKTYEEFLAALKIALIQSESRVLSYSHATRKLGLRSRSSLAMIFKRARVLSNPLVLKLARMNQWSAAEARYIRCLIDRYKANLRGIDDSDFYQEMLFLNHRLSSDVGDKKFHERHATHWHLHAIKNLISLSNFTPDPEWIAKKLKNKISIPEAFYSLQRLLHLGWVERDDAGKYRTVSQCLGVYGAATEDTKSHHVQMLERAKEALDDADADSREMCSTTLAIESRRLSELKKEVLDFCHHVARKYHGANADAVYQINLQMFSHTE